MTSRLDSIGMQPTNMNPCDSPCIAMRSRRMSLSSALLTANSGGRGTSSPEDIRAIPVGQSTESNNFWKSRGTQTDSNNGVSTQLDVRELCELVHQLRQQMQESDRASVNRDYQLSKKINDRMTRLSRDILQSLQLNHFAGGKGTLRALGQLEKPMSLCPELPPMTSARHKETGDANSTDSSTDLESDSLSPHAPKSGPGSRAAASLYAL